MMVNVNPATRMVPERATPVGFGSTEYEIPPVPVPELPELMWIQEKDVNAVQLHSDADGITVKLPLPPAPTTVALLALRLKLQLAPA